MARKKTDTPIDIDWNRWHGIVMESVLAFSLDATLYLCSTLGIRHFSKDECGEHEAVTAETLQREMFGIAEEMLRIHLGGNMDLPRRTASDRNVFFDEAGTLTTQLELWTDSTSRLSIPYVEFKLYTKPGNEVLTINFILAGQVF